MVKAILMAGGKVRKNLKDKEKLEADKHYKDDYLIGKGYKPLRRVRKLFRTNKFSLRKLDKPLIYYPLQALESSYNIEEIYIVGEKTRLETFLKKEDFSKVKQVIQQPGSLFENASAGYNAAGQGHVLFIACDLPKLKAESIDNFLEKCTGEHDVYYPIIGWEVLKKRIWRPLIMLVDNKENNDLQFDDYHRRGFRIGNMVYGNLSAVTNKEVINFAYKHRKLVNPRHRAALKKHVQEYNKYKQKYSQKRLSIEDIEHIVSTSLGTSFKLIEVNQTDIEEDIDSNKDLIEFNKSNLYSPN